jgi:L-ascorbate metabolism protein UlaG (beta-lactamase superfamily)
MLLRERSGVLPTLVPGVLRSIVRAPLGVRRSIGTGNRRLSYPDSPQFRDGLFHNRLPMTVVESGSRSGMAREFATKGRTGKPARPVEVMRPELPAQAAGLAATWLGHATVLLEVGGRRVLTDPVWSERVSPSESVGPRRNHPVPMPVGDLPPIDVVLVSHDHYDHLDTATVDALVATQDAVFVVPLGVGSHLARWGVPPERVVELDWGQSHDLDGLRLTCTEARHFSGRWLGGNTTLWSSWVVAAGDTRVYFGGDSGYTPAYAGIGSDHGPFDLTVLPIGAYDRRWREVHMDPEEAVQAHRELRGEALLPIHWATFDLAFHPWAEPAERVLSAAAEHGVRLALPRPGGRFEPAGELPTDPWWRASA